MEKRIRVPIVILLGILLFGSCSSGKKNEIDRTLTVKIDSVKPYRSKLSVTFPGKIKAASDVALAFRVSGTLLRVHVDAGSIVRKGQVLAEIDPRDYKTQLNATQAEFNRIKGEAERIMQLYEKGSVSKNDFEKAKFGLEQITAKLEAHKNALADTQLRAPFDGYVQRRYFDGNETISAGMPVVTMINRGMPEVEINIPSSDYFERESFDTYSCRVDLFPDEEYQLKLTGVTHKANLNQLYTMKFSFVPGEYKRLPTPGMTTTVKIVKKTDESALSVIPVSAVFSDENGESNVWIYSSENQSVSAKKIDLLGVQRNGFVIVSCGLSVGECIVTAGVHSLKEGCKVTPLAAHSKTNVGGLL